MALYTEKSYGDISKNWERYQVLEQERLQREAQERQRAAQAQYDSAQNQIAQQNQQKKGVLEGILSGIGESIGNVGTSLYNMFGTGAASIGDLVGSIASGKTTTKNTDDWKEYMKGVYGDKNMSDKDYYYKTGGKSLDAAATVSELIPGVGVGAKAALNVGQGAVSGVGQQFANNGANTSLEDALTGGLIGGASSAVGSAVGGKLASSAAKAPAKGVIGKTIQSGIGRSAITGAASGATGGALGSAIYGGDVLQGALEGVGSGAAGGAVTGAVYGALGAGANKLKNKIIDTADGTTNKLPTNVVADTADDNLTPGQKRRQTPMDWGENDLTGQAKKKNYAQKLGSDLQDAAQATRDSSIYGKLKGNTADEMIKKDAINNLRKNYGYSPDDYAEASKLSTAINKWYDNEIQSSGASKVNRNLQGDLSLPANNTLPDKFEKAYRETINNALTMANAGDSDVIDKYSASGLERAAKYLGEQEQKLRRTNMNGVEGRPDGDRAELADYYKNARQVLRNEVNSMIELDDITKNNLSKLLDNAGASEQAKKSILAAQNFSEVKSATSPLEDARTMYKQMKSSGLKRSAAGDNSLNVTTQIANKTGLTNLTDVAGKPIRSAAAGAENIVGKAIENIGNAVAGESQGLPGKTVGRVANAVRATNQGLNVAPFDRLALREISSQAGINAGNNARIEKAQAALQGQADAAQNEYNNAAADYQTAVTAMQQSTPTMATQGAQQLDRISNAMEAAMAAGDFTAYSQLANLYKQAYSIYGSAIEEANKKEDAKALTATQAKALTGLQQIDALESMQPDLGTKLAGSPLSFLVNMGGGNEYANQAQSLALTLGYLQSGANITPKEAENIGKSYVPSAYDSEEVRRNKLARARQLLKNYLGDTTALEQ